MTDLLGGDGYPTLSFAVELIRTPTSLVATRFRFVSSLLFRDRSP